MKTLTAAIISRWKLYKEIVIGLNPNRGKSKNNDHDEILLKAKNKVNYIYI